MLNVGNEPIFKKEHLQNYLIVNKPGTYIVRSHTNVKPKYLISDGNKSRYIIYLKCSTEDKLKECVKILGYRETIAFETVKHCFLKGVLWANNVDDIRNLPAKGEEVIATFETKNGEIVCTNVTLIPRTSLPKFNLYDVCESRKMLKSLIQDEYNKNKH